ncbi:MAG: fibronectin-binding domain-containing protein [Acidobacteria bacterium]|nr:MAG: fibronectin-binding domain-containing protein [Acidobacteriota bacterium]REK02206.1 MAG: fibronectin-binding domain-containing protein [Acidobacteriota bacterium]REK13991.1 MAG: fibronectin-binding domain-containing protein [Acidobacteriota bacterium]REK41986.1 MAG: fibronectin-binding domain-containing protein [Acidobacteriota bacterium]
MNEPTLEKIVQEIAPRTEGARFGRVFNLGSARYAIDLRLSGGEYLYISAEPRSPRLYLIRRRLKELEKASKREDSFASLLRKHLANSTVKAVKKLSNERIVILELVSSSEFEGLRELHLILQLTGRSSNILITDKDGVIVESLKRQKDGSSEPGRLWTPPDGAPAPTYEEQVFDQGDFDSLSQALDAYYTEADEEERLRLAFRSAESDLKSDLKKLRRLRNALEKDLADHGDGEKWKRFGDILLANASTAMNTGEGFEVTDYFDAEAPGILIPADPRHSATQAAEHYFKKYTKARNAKTAIAERLEIATKETERNERKLAELRAAFKAKDKEKIFAAVRKKEKEPTSRKSKRENKSGTSGTRKFKSRDGFEILVGKKSKDNDHLTFRIANSLDTWLHAADYPGSHVVIRNPGRKEIPPSTLADAARLAAFYSKAKNESKAAVRYTLKKFVHKPKGARPGLVSLADFKTIMVEPGIPDAEE